MGKGLKILLGIALILLIIFLVLNLSGHRVNADFFTWKLGNCPQSAKDVDALLGQYGNSMGNYSVCSEFKNQKSVPLIVPTSYRSPYESL